MSRWQTKPIMCRKGDYRRNLERLADRAVFTESFAFIPAEVQTDIVTSFRHFGRPPVCGYWPAQ